MSRSNNDKSLRIGKPIEATADFVRKPPAEPFKFPDDINTIESMVFVALGAASVCWTKKPTGEFMTDRVTEIGQELLKQIEEWYE